MRTSKTKLLILSTITIRTSEPYFILSQALVLISKFTTISNNGKIQKENFHSIDC